MEKVYIKDKQGNKVLPKTHVSAVYDDEGNDLGSHLGAFEDEVRGLVDTPHQEYVTVATYASLPASGSKDTIYRVSNYNGSTSQVDTTSYSEYAWDGSQYIFLCVKSQIDQVFDITVYNNNTKYADLSAALGVNGVNIPESLRKGGMSVKYVQSSDNNYIQARCIPDEFTTDITKWEFVDDKPTIKSINLLKSNGAYCAIYLPIKSEAYIDKSINRGDTTRTPSNDNGLMCAIVDVDEFQKYFIRGKGVGGPRLYFITDQDNNIIQEASSNYTTQGEIIIVPQGGVKLYYNCKYSEFSNPCLRYIGQYIANDYNVDTNKAAASIHIVKELSEKTDNIETILMDNSKTLVTATFYGDSVIVGYNSTDHVFWVSSPTDSNYKSYYISDISAYTGKILKCKFDARPNVGSGKNAILIAATNGTKAEIFRDTNAGAGVDYTDGLLSVDVDKWLAYLATKSISSNEAYFTLEASKGDDYKIYYVTSSLHQGSIPDEIGNLSDLQTTEKKTIVGAINEIAQNGITEEEKQQIIDDAVSEAATTIQRDPISAEQEQQIVQDVIAQVPIQFTQQQIEYLGQLLTTGIFKSIGSSQLSYMQSLGKYIMSYRFKQQVSTPFFNQKLSEEDALTNSAGRTLIHNGYLYCLKMQNHLEHPTIENEYAELVKINLSDPTDYTVLRVFDYNTDYTFEDSSTMHVDYCGEGNFLIINNVMYLTFACVVTINGVSSSQVICRSVDVSTMTITSTNKCTFKSLEGVTGNFNSQFMYDCGYTQSNTDGSGAFLSTGFTEYDGYYYSNCRFRPTSSQLYGMIIRTADMINFEAIFKTPDPTQGETAININSNGIAHIASRSPTWKTDNRMIIRKYNIIDSTTQDVGINNWTLLDSAIIESCLSMPTFFRHNTNLYLWSGGHVHQGNAQGFIDQNAGRKFYKCTLINEASLIDCVTQFDTDYVQIGPNTILTSDGTYIYGCVTGVNLVVVRFEMPSVTVGECDAILAELLT